MEEEAAAEDEEERCEWDWWRWRAGARGEMSSGAGRAAGWSGEEDERARVVEDEEEGGERNEAAMVQKGSRGDDSVSELEGEGQERGARWGGGERWPSRQYMVVGKTTDSNQLGSRVRRGSGTAAGTTSESTSPLAGPLSPRTSPGPARPATTRDPSTDL